MKKIYELFNDSERAIYDKAVATNLRIGDIIAKYELLEDNYGVYGFHYNIFNSFYDTFEINSKKNVSDSIKMVLKKVKFNGDVKLKEKLKLASKYYTENNDENIELIHKYIRYIYKNVNSYIDNMLINFPIDKRPLIYTNFNFGDYISLFSFKYVMKPEIDGDIYNGHLKNLLSKCDKEIDTPTPNADDTKPNKIYYTKNIVNLVIFDMNVLNEINKILDIIEDIIKYIKSMVENKKVLSFHEYIIDSVKNMNFRIKTIEIVETY